MSCLLCGIDHPAQGLNASCQDTFGVLTQSILPCLEEVKPTFVYSGMETGFGQALALSALIMHIPLIVVTPYQGLDVVRTRDSKELYDYLIQYNTLIHHVCDSDYIGCKVQACNEWMINHSDTVLAMWDGSNTDEIGTMLKYAKKKKKAVINLWDQLKDKHLCMV